jgi:hypothetical protein
MGSRLQAAGINKPSIAVGLGTLWECVVGGLWQCWCATARRARPQFALETRLQILHDSDSDSDYEHAQRRRHRSIPGGALYVRAHRMQATTTTSTFTSCDPLLQVKEFRCFLVFMLEGLLALQRHRHVYSLSGRVVYFVSVRNLADHRWDKVSSSIRIVCMAFCGRGGKEVGTCQFCLPDLSLRFVSQTRREPRLPTPKTWRPARRQMYPLMYVPFGNMQNWHQTRS